MRKSTQDITALVLCIFMVNYVTIHVDSEVHKCCLFADLIQ